MRPFSLHLQLHHALLRQHSRASTKLQLESANVLQSEIHITVRPYGAMALSTQIIHLDGAYLFLTLAAQYSTPALATSRKGTFLPSSR